MLLIELSYAGTGGGTRYVNADTIKYFYFNDNHNQTMIVFQDDKGIIVNNTVEEVKEQIQAAKRY